MRNDFNDEKAIQEEMRQQADSFCTGRVVCVHCGAYYGYCIAVETQLVHQGDDSTMTIPRASNVGPTQGGGSGGGRTRGKQQGLEYVRWDSPFLSYDKKTARILETKINVPVEGRQQFSDVVLKISIEGKPRLYGMKADNPELEKMVEWWGDDENRWINNEFLIYLEEDSFDGKKWVRVAQIEGEKTEKKGKK